MKITDYPKVSDFHPKDVFLTDGERGTKTIYIPDAVTGAVDASMDAIMHRMIYRGKNLGAEVTSEQLVTIKDGTFRDLYLGDYWVINNVTWRIADFDYWRNSGDTAFVDHHLVIVPDENLGNQPMNSTNITTGGYVGSGMYKTNLSTAKSMITNTFGNNVCTHRQLFTNAVHTTGGYPSSGEFVDANVYLMNEIMVFGSYIFAPAVAGNTTTAVVVPYRHTIDRSQLALFMVNTRMINPGRYSYWLRDVVSASHFAHVSNGGYANYASATASYGVRPCFPIG